jgi:Transposase
MEVYVGMDVHRKRSQVAVLDARGTQLLNRNLPNDPAELVTVLGGLASGTPVAFEAAYGWGWLVELLEDLGLEPHLVHPTRCKAIASPKLKHDKVDARTLAHLLPEAWIAPQHIRDQRAPCDIGGAGPAGHRGPQPRPCRACRPRAAPRAAAVVGQRPGLAGGPGPATGPAGPGRRLASADRRPRPHGGSAGARPAHPGQARSPR